MGLPPRLALLLHMADMPSLQLVEASLRFI